MSDQKKKNKLDPVETPKELSTTKLGFDDSNQLTNKDYFNF